MSVKPSVNTLKSTTTTTNKDVVSYNTTKKRVVCKNTRKLQQVPTKVLASQLERSRSLALLREGKINGALMRVTIDIYEIGLEELERRQQHTTSYAFSGQSEYRADKVDKLMQIKNELNIWNTSKSSSSYPYFHINTIHDVIKKVIGIVDKRTHNNYFNIIIKLCGNEVSTARFDITGFMSHEFRNRIGKVQ